jgi:hypothetical protein
MAVLDSFKDHAMTIRTTAALSPAASSTRDALDQLDELNACMSAVADLASPSNDLHCVDRNNLAMLLGLLLRLQEQAMEDAWAGMAAMNEREREPEGEKLTDSISRSRISRIREILASAKPQPSGTGSE